MKRRFVQGLWVSALLASAVYAQEVGEQWQLAHQLVLDIENERVLTRAKIEVPVTWVGGMTLEEFAQRFNDPANQHFVKVLMAIRKGESGVAGMLEQTERASITDEGKFVALTQRLLFPKGGSYKVEAMIPLENGKAYLDEVTPEKGIPVRGLRVMRRDKEGKYKLALINESAVLDLLNIALRSPTAAHELKLLAEEEKGKVLSGNPWEQISVKVLMPGDKTDLFEMMTELANTIERTKLKQGLASGSQRRLDLWLGNATPEDLKRGISSMTLPLREPLAVYSFSPVYVAISEDQSVEPVVLINDPEHGLQIANLNRIDAFSELVKKLRQRGWPKKARKPEPQEEPEQAPH